jgi:hypothetical protein
MEVEQFRIKQDQKDKTTCYSYGNKIGNFGLTNDIITKLALNKNICQNYALVEKKTEYYKLMFDFDFKADILYYLIDLFLQN